MGAALWQRGTLLIYIKQNTIENALISAISELMRHDH
jgi:hypothetical protein